jgi:hypothetical protein
VDRALCVGRRSRGSLNRCAHLPFSVSQRTAFFPFYPAIIAAALYGGTGPALLAIAISTFIAYVLPSTSAPVSVLPFLFFVLVNLVIVWLCGRTRQALQREVEAIQRVRVGKRVCYRPEILRAWIAAQAR